MFKSILKNTRDLLLNIPDMDSHKTYKVLPYFTGFLKADKFDTGKEYNFVLFGETEKAIQVGLFVQKLGCPLSNEMILKGHPWGPSLSWIPKAWVKKESVKLQFWFQPGLKEHVSIWEDYITEYMKTYFLYQY